MDRDPPITPPFTVNAREVREVLALEIPAHPETEFDEAQFKDLVARSFSISLDEKKRMVRNVPGLSQHQVNEVLRILAKERSDFATINKRRAERGGSREAKHLAKVLPFRPRE